MHPSAAPSPCRRRRAAHLAAGLAACGVALTLWGAAQAQRVELELVTEAGFPLTGSHQWLQALEGAGADSLRIRGAQPADRPQIERFGSDAAPTYRVTGVLTARNELLLPGGRFTMHERGAIRQWIDRLRQGGAEGLSARPMAFGLAAQELVDLHQALSAPVNFSTKELDPKTIVRRLAGVCPVPIAVDPASVTAFDEPWLLPDELRGLSCGTALAAAVRPMGQVVVPRKRSGRLELWITDFRKAEESWPIGWPPEKKERDLAPKLFEFLTIEIGRGAKLAEVLPVMQQRLEMPMLLDHNALARRRIDPAAAAVELEEGRTYYKRALDRLLFKAGLRGEMRIDEAGAPFYWISTLGR